MNKTKQKQNHQYFIHQPFKTPGFLFRHPKLTHCLKWQAQPGNISQAGPVRCDVLLATASLASSHKQSGQQKVASNVYHFSARQLGNSPCKGCKCVTHQIWYDYTDTSSIFIVLSEIFAYFLGILKSSPLKYLNLPLTIYRIYRDPTEKYHFGWPGQLAASKWVAGGREFLLLRNLILEGMKHHETYSWDRRAILQWKNGTTIVFRKPDRVSALGSCSKFRACQGLSARQTVDVFFQRPFVGDQFSDLQSDAQMVTWSMLNINIHILNLAKVTVFFGLNVVD